MRRLRAVAGAASEGGPQADCGELAQLGERLVCNQEVTGSSPVFSIPCSWARTDNRAGPPRRSPAAAWWFFTPSYGEGEGGIFDN